LIAHDALGGRSTLAHAVRDADALVSGACHVQAGLVVQEPREAGEAGGVTDDGLRVCAVIAEDASEARLAERAHEALEPRPR
jgi:hypothetical protein